jgi:hypothetical protein
VGPDWKHTSSCAKRTPCMLEMYILDCCMALLVNWHLIKLQASICGTTCHRPGTHLRKGSVPSLCSRYMRSASTLCARESWSRTGRGTSAPFRRNRPSSA